MVFEFKKEREWNKDILSTGFVSELDSEKLNEHKDWI